MIGAKKGAKADEIRVALFGGVLAVDGQRYMVQSGERVRTSHPLVRKYPRLFAPDGLTDGELAQARADYSAWKESVTR